MRNLIFITLISATILNPAGSNAAPSTFEPVIGGGLQCLDQIEPSFFQSYLSTYFKEPYKNEGGALWYKMEGVQLFGLEVEEAFVSYKTEHTDFIGVIFNAKLEDARKSIQQTRGIRFVPEASPTVLRSAAGSYLIEYDRTKSKMFCVKYRP